MTIETFEQEIRRRLCALEAQPKRLNTLIEGLAVICQSHTSSLDDHGSRVCALEQAKLPQCPPEHRELVALNRNFDARFDVLRQRLDTLEQTVKENDEARHFGEGELRGYNQALERHVVELEARLPAIPVVTPLAFPLREPPLSTQVGPGVAPQNLAITDYLLAPTPDYRSDLPGDEACYECGTKHGPDENTQCPLSSVYAGPSIEDPCSCEESEALRAAIARLGAELADASKLYSGALDAQAEAEQKWFAAREESEQLRAELGAASVELRQLAAECDRMRAAVPFPDDADRVATLAVKIASETESYQRALKTEYAKREAVESELSAALQTIDLLRSLDNVQRAVAYLDRAEKAEQRVTEQRERIKQDCIAAEERAAEVARLREELAAAERKYADVATSTRHGERLDEMEARAEAAEAQVAELTRERDEVRSALQLRGKLVNSLNAEVTRLTEALAVAEREMRSSHRVCENLLRARDAVEARARELEAENVNLRDARASVARAHGSAIDQLAAATDAIDVSAAYEGNPDITMQASECLPAAPCGRGRIEEGLPPR